MRSDEGEYSLDVSEEVEEHVEGVDEGLVVILIFIGSEVETYLPHFLDFETSQVQLFANV